MYVAHWKFWFSTINHNNNMAHEELNKRSMEETRRHEKRSGEKANKGVWNGWIHQVSGDEILVCLCVRTKHSCNICSNGLLQYTVWWNKVGNGWPIKWGKTNTWVLSQNSSHFITALHRKLHWIYLARVQAPQRPPKLRTVQFLLVGKWSCGFLRWHDTGQNYYLVYATFIHFLLVTLSRLENCWWQRDCWKKYPSRSLPTPEPPIEFIIIDRIRETKSIFESTLLHSKPCVFFQMQMKGRKIKTKAS